jgi:hypothetical protein
MSSTAVRYQPLAYDVQVTEDELIVSLTDGRRVSAPLVWFPRLLKATPAVRADWRFIGDGEGIHWSGADEDISVEGLLLGVPSVEFARPQGGPA